MSTEKYRYCDLCGGPAGDDAGKLSVPDAPKARSDDDSYNSGLKALMFSSMFGGSERSSSYDICRECVLMLLGPRFQHHEAAAAKLRDAVAAEQAKQLAEMASADADNDGEDFA